MQVNIVHFRNWGKSLTDYVFKFGSCALQVVKVYKYLGLLFDEFVTFDARLDFSRTRKAKRTVVILIVCGVCYCFFSDNLIR